MAIILKSLIKSLCVITSESQFVSPSSSHRHRFFLASTQVSVGSTQVFLGLDTGFPWFPWVQERMLSWFPPFQVASTCLSCNPPDLNSVVTNCLLSYYVKWPLPPGDSPTAVNKYYCYYKNQSVYAVSGTRRCLFSDKYKTHKYSVGRAYSCWMLNWWCIT